jgi:hypothetical protein
MIERGNDMAQATQQAELFKSGQKINYSGEYEIVDKNGQNLGYEPVALNEGENFPALNDVENKGLYFKLQETCNENEQCEPIGGPTPEVD